MTTGLCPRCQQSVPLEGLDPTAENFCVVEIAPNTLCDYPLFLVPTARAVAADSNPNAGRPVYPGEEGRIPLASRVCRNKACQTLNHRQTTHCVECGEPLDPPDGPAQEVRTVYQERIEQVEVHPRWWKWRWWIAAGAGVVLIGLGVLIAVLF